MDSLKLELHRRHEALPTLNTDTVAQAGEAEFLEILMAHTSFNAELRESINDVLSMIASVSFDIQQAINLRKIKAQIEGK